MAGLTVPQMVPATNTNFLGRIIEGLQQGRENTQIKEAVQGIRPEDPSSLATATANLYRLGRPGIEMADRLNALYQKRDVVVEDRKTAAQEKKDELDAWKAAAPKIGQDIPTDDSPAAATPAPVSAVPQRLGGAVQPSNRVWGDDEATAAGLYEAPKPQAAAGPAQMVPMGGPGGVSMRPLPPPPPRSGAAPAAPTEPPAVPAAAAAPLLPASGPAQRMAGGPLPSVPAPLRAAPGPTPLLPISAAAPRFEELVPPLAPEVAQPAPRRSTIEIQRRIGELNRLRGDPRIKNKDGITSEIKRLDDELKHRNDQDKELYKANVSHRKGYDQASTNDAIATNKEVSKQLKSDYGLVASLSEQNRILQDGVRTGLFAETILMAKKGADLAGSILELLPGVDKDAIPGLKSLRTTSAAMERFQGLGQKALHDVLGGFGHGISTPDANRLHSIVGSLDKTVKGNATLIQFTLDLAQARVNAGEEVTRYMQSRMAKREFVSSADINQIQSAHAKHAIDQMEAKVKTMTPEEGKKPPTEKKTPEALSPPKAGDLVGGMRFKGGDPRDRKNWEPGT